MLVSRCIMKYKKYTAKQKYDYHLARQFNPDKYKIGAFGNKHLYSIGFCDAINDCDNRKAFNSKSYDCGYNNGLKCYNAYHLGK